MKRQAQIPFVALLLLALAGPGRAQPDATRLSVVELFTSQGCSSCPPANDNVAAISSRPDVIALSFSVTYWDQLGWKDTFALPAYTQRQVNYARSLGHDAPFTPQVVVDGKADVVGARPGEIERLVGQTRIEGPKLVVANGALSIGAGRAPLAPADIWLVRYDPHVVMVSIGEGENAGKSLPHKNVVKALVRLGGWSGQAMQIPLPSATPGLSSAILVQTKGAGPILAAARG